MDRLDSPQENQSARADTVNDGLNSIDILSGVNQTKPSPLKLDADSSKKYPPIGTAEMLGDESLHLHLHAETPDHKTHGDGDLTILPGDKNYQSIRSHIGDINPGQIKFVSPWLDQNGLPTNSGATIKRGDVTGPDVISSQPQAPGVLPADVVTPPSANFAAGVDKTYNAMSAETRAIVTHMGAKVVAVHHLTDAMPELKGQAPRGWPTGATWDAVDGCYSGGKKEIIVAEERQSLANNKWIASGRSDQVLRHETGHAVDYTINMLSEHVEFKTAYDQDVQAMPAKDKNQLEYFLQTGTAGREETVAESIADREGGATGGITFHTDFANVLKVVNDTVDAIGKNPGAPIAPVIANPGVPLNPADVKPPMTKSK